MATLAAYGKNKDKRRDVSKTDMPFGGTYKHVTIQDKAGNIKKTKIKRKYPDGAKSKKVIKGDKWKQVDRDGLKRTVTRGKITNDGESKRPDERPNPKYKSKRQLKKQGLMYDEFFNDKRIDPRSNTTVPELRKRRLKSGL